MISPYKKRGQVSLQVLIFATVMIIITTGFASWAGALMNMSLKDTNRAQALQIAEAGIEYYRWHLAHDQTDYTDGTGEPGPYVHDYYNKDGTKIGTFTLDITPPPLGSNVVTIVSEGRVLADQNVLKIIEAKLAIPSFARFSAALNTNVRFGEGTVIYGPVMSNGGIRFDGFAHNVVQSAQSSYDDPDHGGQNEFGVHTHVSPADPLPPASAPLRPDVFSGGREFPVPALDFSGMNQNLADLKSKAQNGGFYAGPSGVSGYDVELMTNGTFALYRVTATTPPPNGCTNTSNEAGWGTWSIQTEDLLSTNPYPANGVIFLEDNIWVRGQVNGNRITVASGRFPDNPATRTNATINTNVRYTNYNASDTIGIIAQNNVNVGLFSDDILRIDGALVAQNGRVGRYYYSPPNPQNNSQKCGSTVVRQEVTLYGSIISNNRYGFGFNDLTGYLERNIIYDPNLLYAPPPSFPMAGSQYEIVSWKEIK